MTAAIGLPPLRATLPTPEEIAQHPILRYIPNRCRKPWLEVCRETLLRLERAHDVGTREHFTDTFVALMELPGLALRRGRGGRGAGGGARVPSVLLTVKK